MDPYQACPCGSGKNFKWCCQPFFALVEKARGQYSQGQKDQSLRTIQQLVEQQPNNAAVLGYQAELLYMSEKPDEADDVLQKAFAIDPQFPFGHWLRGMLRKDEGEVVGALIQFRKAAETYDPKAHEVLADIEAAIFDIEMRLNRPVAAHAALQRAMRHDATAEPLQKAAENVFGIESRLPTSARKQYAFRPAAADRLEAWQTTLPTAQISKLGEARKAFEKLTADESADGPAWFNLGLVQAWLGENGKAIDSLEKANDLESDDAQVAETGALIEVLRCGEGMEDDSDYIEHRIFFQMHDAEPVVRLLEEWSRGGRMSGAQQDQETGTLSALILEDVPKFDAGIGTPASRLGAYMLIVGNIMRLWSPRKERLDAVAEEVRQKAGSALQPPMEEEGYCSFSDIAMEAMLIPTENTQIQAVAGRLTEEATQFFEQTWLDRPLQSLSGRTPRQAADEPGMRKKLVGVVAFMEECFVASSPRVSDGDKLQIVVVYDFRRLRGLLKLSEMPADVPAVAPIDLATADPTSLDDEAVQQAFRAALQKDDRELAAKFAEAAIVRAGIADRYPFFNHLIGMATGETVLSIIEEAIAADAATNDSVRAHDYALKRGQVLGKQGQPDASFAAFRELLNRVPDELKLYGPAVESLLSQKQGARALELAEKGLERARSKQNRDVEGYLSELAGAAKRT